MFVLSRDEEKELRQQYYDDPLFCLVSPMLKGVTVGNKFKHITVVYIWKTALELCQELGRCPRPELEVAEAFTNLEKDLEYAIKDPAAYQIEAYEAEAALGLISACALWMLSCKHDEAYQATCANIYNYFQKIVTYHTIPQAFYAEMTNVRTHIDTDIPPHDYTANPSPLPANPSPLTANPLPDNRLTLLEQQVADLTMQVQQLQERLDARGAKRTFAEEQAHRRQLLKQALERVQSFTDKNGFPFLAVHANWYFPLRIFAEQGLYESYVSYQPYLDDLKAIKLLPDKLTKADLAQKKDYLTPDCCFPDWDVPHGKPRTQLPKILEFGAELSEVFVH